MTKPSLAARAFSLLRLGGRSPRTLYAPDELHLIPSDLRTPDPEYLDELAAGTMPLAGGGIALGRGNPFATPLRNQEIDAALQGFGWLNHLSCDPDRGRGIAQRLVGQWLGASVGSSRERPDVVARRVISWITHGGLLLEEADPQLFADVMTDLVRQVRWLEGLKSGQPLLSRIAVLLADLTLAGRAGNIAGSMQALTAALALEIGTDGGHVSRNPTVPLALLLDLLPLRQCFASHHIAPSEAFQDAIARMGSHLRAMRLGDGSLGRFNGSAAAPLDDLVTVLSVIPQDESDGALGASGYRRLAQSGTIILMDCGAAPPTAFAQSAQAGCLSFEMSHGDTPILRNCGCLESAPEKNIALARATSSHNTLTLAERSSGRLVTTATAAGARDGLAGPREVTILDDETSDGAPMIAARHNGYEEQFGILHTRRLALNGDGTCLTGDDVLEPRDGILRLGKDLPFAIHFHVAPKSTIDQTGVGEARIRLPDGSAWTLTATHARVSVETDQASALGPRRVHDRQIVLRGTTPGETRVGWVLRREGSANA